MVFAPAGILARLRKGHWVSIAGVGWTLSGFSAIEWVRPGDPQWPGLGDKYFLDGQELIACVTGSVSPSCTTGGTHSTKIESYLRIKFDSTVNTWTIWGKDGTKTTFSAVPLPGSYSIRWGQTSTVDTFGNAVAYGWECQDGDCYPRSVSYNGYTVTLYRESRPDPLSFPEGYAIGTTQYRLRSVIVQLGANPIRGYKLTYATSAASGRSLLVSVQQYGKDLVQVSGAISSGTALPARTFAYQGDTVANSFQTFILPSPSPSSPTLENVVFRQLTNVGASGNTVWKTGGTSAWDAGASSTRAIAAGDGYVEWDYYGGGSKMVGLNDADNGPSWQELDYAMDTSGGVLYICESGAIVASGWNLSDGMVLRIEISNGAVRYKINGITIWTSTRPPSYPLIADTSINDPGTTLYNLRIQGALVDVAFPFEGYSPRTGDFNGDGRTDLMVGGPGTLARVMLATATGFSAPSTWLSGWSFTQPMWADFDGDGRTDLGDYQGDYFFVALSNGTSFNAPVAWGHSGNILGDDGRGHACYGSATILTGDFNGDGRADIFCRTPTDTYFIVGLSGGSGFSFALWQNSPCQGILGVADFNGDGRDDVYCIDTANSVLTAFFSNGAAFIQSNAHTSASFCSMSEYAVGDLNGDGRADVVCNWNGAVALSTGVQFAEQGSFGGWCYAGRVLFGSFDGAGSALLCDNVGAPANDIEVRKWQAGALTTPQTWKASCGGATLGDFNGDGKTDLYCDSLPNPISLAGTGGVRADLLTTEANGLGAITQVTYTPSSSFSNTNNPPVSYAVTSSVTSDGRGSTSLTTYSYSGGAINRGERQALGFAAATTRLPCIAGESTCPSIDTWFRQDLGSVGKISSQVRRDQAGHALTQRTLVYSTNGSTIPRTSLLTEEWTYTLDGTGASCSTYPCASVKRTQSATQYDSYANPTRNDFSGDYDATGDDTATTGAIARTRPPTSSVVSRKRSTTALAPQPW
jgi:hypothetical protein